MEARLVRDEFDGTKLDESKWSYQYEGRRRDGFWNRKAVALDGKGHLVMKTRYGVRQSALMPAS